MGLATQRLLLERERAGRPVSVGVIGPGFTGGSVIYQIAKSTPGMRVTCVHSRDVAKGRAALVRAGITRTALVDSVGELERAVARGEVGVTQDVSVLTAADSVDVVLDATGSIEFGAGAALGAFENGKHLVLVNAELDATVGYELSRRAERAGVICTGCDGDQPGVQMNLYRFVREIGLTPLLCGNVKGLQDRYRTPTTQRAFAEQRGQNPRMVSSFADGTKVNVEQALVANATGMTIHRRGLLGRDHHGHVDELTTWYDVDELRALGGAVDYVVGARPGPGVFVLATHDDPEQRRYLDIYKLGPGPLYSFYTPYHLCHFEIPGTIAKVELLGEATIWPAGPPSVEVVAVAKTDVTAGTVLDAIGGYHYYGECERADVTAADGLLPVGVAEGCRLLRGVGRDQVITYADVEVPAGRLVDELRRAQATG